MFRLSLDLSVRKVNCRCQGGDGFWIPLCRAMTGYDQVDACIASYLDRDAFQQLPSIPSFEAG